MTGEEIRLEVTENLARITLNRPAKRNSLTPEMIARLDAALDVVERSDAVRVVIVTGAGEVAFSSGADLTRFAEQDRESAWRHWVPSGHRVLSRLESLPQPTVAVLNGNAFGGGLELALACDLRLAADDVSVGLPEVSIGTLPGWAGTGRLVAAVGLARARQVILTGLPVDARRAAEWGLITECAPRDQLLGLVDRYVAALSSRGPVAVGLAKQVLTALDDSAHTSQVLELLAGALTVTTDDLAEGIAAFRGKRPPTFKGA